jgi:hypothetical protein
VAFHATASDCTPQQLQSDSLNDVTLMYTYNERSFCSISLDNSQLNSLVFFVDAFFRQSVHFATYYIHLTTWSRVLLQKLTVTQLVKKFPVLY